MQTIRLSLKLTVNYLNRVSIDQEKSEELRTFKLIIKTIIAEMNFESTSLFTIFKDILDYIITQRVEWFD